MQRKSDKFEREYAHEMRENESKIGVPTTHNSLLDPHTKQKKKRSNKKKKIRNVF